MTLFLIIFCILVFIMVGVIIFDSNRFVMREYTVVSDKLDKDRDVLFISDMHCTEYGKDNEKLIDRLNNLEFDACFLAGDMITAVKDHSVEPAVKLINELANRCPVFYSYGNHELRASVYKETYGEMFSNLTENISVSLMNNAKASFEDIDVFGLNIEPKFYHRFKKNSLSKEQVYDYVSKPDKERFSVLLAHNPEYFDTYAEASFDLVLSGHVHGGIVRIPFSKGLISPRYRLFPKYDGGEFKKGASVMVLNRGLGMHTIRLRMFNPAEIVLIHLKKD